VHNYLAQEGGDSWKGSLFVFDDRLAVPAKREGEAKELFGCSPCMRESSTSLAVRPLLRLPCMHISA